MRKITKVYDVDGLPAYYFVDNVRVDAYDDISLLQTLYGNRFEEYWIDDATGSEDDEVQLSRMSSVDTLDEFEEIIEEHPHLIKEL